MKAIMMSIRPEWCAKILNGEKTIEVRTSKALANTIQKLIDKYGYAEIYVYCSKNGGNLVYGTEYRGGSFVDEYGITRGYSKQKANEIFGLLNGKVIFKFRCYKVEEIEDVYSQENEFGGLCESYGTKTLKTNSLLNKAQLDYLELADYLNDYTPFGYAIHISDLEIFDEPKELSEVKRPKWSKCGIKDKNGLYQCDKCPYGKKGTTTCEYDKPIKAPQNFCYVEVEE